MKLSGLPQAVHALDAGHTDVAELPGMYRAQPCSPRRVVDAGTITFSLRFQLTPELGLGQVLSARAPGLPRRIVREQFEVFHR